MYHVRSAALRQDCVYFNIVFITVIPPLIPLYTVHAIHNIAVRDADLLN